MEYTWHWEQTWNIATLTPKPYILLPHQRLQNKLSNKDGWLFFNGYIKNSANTQIQYKTCSSGRKMILVVGPPTVCQCNCLIKVMFSLSTSHHFVYKTAISRKYIRKHQTNPELQQLTTIIASETIANVR